MAAASDGSLGCVVQELCGVFGCLAVTEAGLASASGDTEHLLTSFLFGLGRNPAPSQLKPNRLHIRSGPILDLYHHISSTCSD